MSTRLEIQLLRDEVRGLKRVIERREAQESGDVGRYISAELGDFPYNLNLLPYDVVSVVHRGINAGVFTRKDVIKFMQLEKKENN